MHFVSVSSSTYLTDAESLWQIEIADQEGLKKKNWIGFITYPVFHIIGSLTS
jgi:hypothetical protein